VASLKALGRLLGVSRWTPVSVQSDAVARLSSSRVRELLAEGDVARRAEMPGRPHSVTGTVISGEPARPGTGLPDREFWLPARIGACPRRRLRGMVIDGDCEPMPAAISIGTNPTFAENLSRRWRPT